MVLIAHRTRPDIHPRIEQGTAVRGDADLPSRARDIRYRDGFSGRGVTVMDGGRPPIHTGFDKVQSPLRDCKVGPEHRWHYAGFLSAAGRAPPEAPPEGPLLVIEEGAIGRFQWMPSASPGHLDRLLFPSAGGHSPDLVRTGAVRGEIKPPAIARPVRRSFSGRTCRQLLRRAALR